MNDIQQLKELLHKAEINFPILLEFKDDSWTYDEADSTVLWGFDENGDANYSAWGIEGYERQDGFFIVNIDYETGVTGTLIFDEAKEVKYEN